MRPRLYIPVETAARELDAKLLLALFVADLGTPVVLGNRALLSNAIHTFEPGIFLTHNFDPRRRRILKIVRDLGHAIVAWDEEGLVWTSAETYRRRRVDPKAVAMIRSIYAWGDEHARALAPVTDAAEVQVLSIGNPRADLLRPGLRPLYEHRVQELRTELGEFILINSNFGWLNYALSAGPSAPRGDALTEIARRSGHPEEFLRFRLEVFEAFVRIIPILATRFPDRSIVVRPHPSEDPAVWKAAVDGHDNVQVRYEHDLVPWLMAADAIVHNGCTTAVEAAMLGRVPVMYRPIDGGEFESSQPRAVSAEVETTEALLDFIANGPDRASRESAGGSLKRLIGGQDDRLSAQSIAQDIAGMTNEPGTSSRLGRVAGQARSRIRALEKSLGRFARTSPSNPDYIAKKFPPTSVDRIGQRLHRFASLLDLPVPCVTESSDRIYAIERADA